MKKLLILLLLCSCANIPEDQRMKCTKIARRLKRCENNTSICFKVNPPGTGLLTWYYRDCKDKEK